MGCTKLLDYLCEEHTKARRKSKKALGVWNSNALSVLYREYTDKHKGSGKSLEEWISDTMDGRFSHALALTPDGGKGILVQEKFLCGVCGDWEAGDWFTTEYTEAQHTADGDPICLTCQGLEYSD